MKLTLPRCMLPLQVLLVWLRENDVPVVGGHSKSLVLLSNDQRPVGPLQLQLDRMASLMEANAFVHQFEGAGVSRDALQDAAATAECVLADYVGMGGN